MKLLLIVSDAHASFAFDNLSEGLSTARWKECIANFGLFLLTRLFERQPQILSISPHEVEDSRIVGNEQIRKRALAGEMK